LNRRGERYAFSRVSFVALIRLRKLSLINAAVTGKPVDGIVIILRFACLITMQSTERFSSIIRRFASLSSEIAGHRGVLRKEDEKYTVIICGRTSRGILPRSACSSRGREGYGNSDAPRRRPSRSSDGHSQRHPPSGHGLLCRYS